MEYFIFLFPISGVKTYIFLPPLVMLAISSIVSIGGVSGAFVLLPFQMSVLGYTNPGVTATNFIYNIISIPSGIYRYIKNKQISWTLFFTIMFGTLPGIFIGYYIRTKFLFEPARFKIFVGCILGILGIKTIHSGLTKNQGDDQRDGIVSIEKEKAGIFGCKIYTNNKVYKYSPYLLAIASFLVGIAGTAYGIGGGAIIAPFCVSILGLPVFLVSGAALFSTWINSVIAAMVYSFNSATTPDWLLGALFGIGGMIGIYTGTYIQRYVPDNMVKNILGIVLLFISSKYILF